jgi:hypothetical protein
VGVPGAGHGARRRALARTDDSDGSRVAAAAGFLTAGEAGNNGLGLDGVSESVRPTTRAGPTPARWSCQRRPSESARSGGGPDGPRASRGRRARAACGHGAGHGLTRRQWQDGPLCRPARVSVGLSRGWSRLWSQLWSRLWSRVTALVMGLVTGLGMALVTAPVMEPVTDSGSGHWVCGTVLQSRGSDSLTRTFSGAPGCRRRTALSSLQDRDIHRGVCVPSRVLWGRSCAPLEPDGPLVEGRVTRAGHLQHHIRRWTNPQRERRGPDRRDHPSCSDQRISGRLCRMVWRQAPDRLRRSGVVGTAKQSSPSPAPRTQTPPGPASRRRPRPLGPATCPGRR